MHLWGKGFIIKGNIKEYSFCVSVKPSTEVRYGEESHHKRSMQENVCGMNSTEVWYFFVDRPDGFFHQ